MGQFHKMPFHQRLGAMGDQAETVFERTYPEGWARFGLNRPPINVSMLPQILRYTPDYITAKGLVECQGFGRDQLFKLKLTKWASLLEWNRIHRTDLFLWDSHNKQFGWLRLGDFASVLDRGWAKLKAFENDGNEYWELEADAVPVVGWHPYELEAS